MGSAKACRKKFLTFYPGGFRDADYVELERSYKWDAHKRWNDVLGRATFAAMLHDGRYKEIAQAAVRVESRTNLLFSFEKMALRDAVATSEGAREFSQGLYEWLHGVGSAQAKFEQWCKVVDSLPRRQTRVFTWPVTTVFGFLAQPTKHLYLKPTVTKVAAQAYGYDFVYKSRPNWETYAGALEFARTVKKDTADLKPRDMIDAQGFIWVQGSAEYEL